MRDQYIHNRGSNFPYIKKDQRFNIYFPGDGFKHEWINSNYFALHFSIVYLTNHKQDTFIGEVKINFSKTCSFAEGCLDPHVSAPIPAAL